MHRRTLAPVLLLAALALPACGERESPEKASARRTARRDACVAEEMYVQSRERLATLEETLRRQQAGGDAMVVLTQSAQTFAASYHAYAEARWRGLALADSAARATTPADSGAFARRAAQYRVMPGGEATVQENATRDYERDFTRQRLNPDHPCNQAQEDAKE